MVPDPLDWMRRPGAGRYARPERERRFLVRADPPGRTGERRIEDRYVTGTTLRLRHVRVGQESVYKLTQKVRVDRADPADLSLTNTYLSAEEHALLCELPNRLVTKTRSVCPSETHDVVLDEFHGHLDGLRLAEVEVRDLGEHVLLPAWLGAEVTHDDRFSGGRLAVATGLEVRDVLRWVSGGRSTASLRLRPLSLDDLAAVIEVEADPATNRHSPTGPPTSPEVEQRLRVSVEAWTRDGVGCWAVEHDGELVGVAGLRRMALQGRDCWNLYYRLRPSAWGKGFGREAARAAIALADGCRPRLPVLARTRPTNAPAQRVAQASGLQRRPDLDSDGFQVFASWW